jgi:hypothetical protein
MGCFQQLKGLPPFRVSKKMVLEKQINSHLEYIYIQLTLLLVIAQLWSYQRVKNTHKNMEIITESEHSDPKLRITFGNCCGETQNIFCSVYSLDVGNLNDSILKNLSGFNSPNCQICY